MLEQNRKMKFAASHESVPDSSLETTCTCDDSFCLGELQMKEFNFIATE